MDRQKRQYTPIKLSKLTNITNFNPSTSKPTTDYNRTSLDYNRTDYSKTNAINADYSKTNSDYYKLNVNYSKINADYCKLSPDYSKLNADYSKKSIGPAEMSILKDYQVLKMQVRQMQSQNRQLSNDIEELRYQKNIYENKYHQKLSCEQEAVAQFQKQTSYQLQSIKLKNDEDCNRLKREFEYKIDQLHRELRNKDYHNRQSTEKNSYLDLKINQLQKGIEILQFQHVKYRQANAVLNQRLNKEEFNKQKLLSLTEELERQKAEMEEEIHVLLDIEAEKSKTINTTEIQFRNSEATERSLHEKLTVLTDNFANLENHIASMKERLISTDMRNQQLEKQLQGAELQLSDKDNSLVLQKELQVKLREELQIQQQRQVRREKQIDQLILQNERLVGSVNINRQRLHDLCIAQGIQV